MPTYDFSDAPAPPRRYQKSAEPIEYEFEGNEELLESARGRRKEESERITKGTVRNVGQAVTYAFGDELEAGVRSLFEGRTSSDIHKEILAEMQEYREDFPVASTVQEFMPALAVGGVVANVGAKVGTKVRPWAARKNGRDQDVIDAAEEINTGDLVAVGSAEGIAYGYGSGETMEQRAQLAIMGGLTGLAVGKVVEKMTKPLTQGGMKTPVDENIDAAMDDLNAGDTAQQNMLLAQNRKAYEEAERIQDIRLKEAERTDLPSDSPYTMDTPEGAQALDAEMEWTIRNMERDPLLPPEPRPDFEAMDFRDTNSPYNRYFSDIRGDRPVDNALGQNQKNMTFGEATNVNELWGALKTSFANVYDDYMRGVSDVLMSRVSPQVGALVQRSDETATRKINVDMDSTKLLDRINPVIQRMESDADIKGIYLDFSAGLLTNKKGEAGWAESHSKLRELMTGKLDDDQIDTMFEWINYSTKKNRENMSHISRADFDPFRTYGATKLTKEAKKRKIKEKEEIEDEFGEFDLPMDTAVLKRTRGSYTNDAYNGQWKKKKVDPADYENPILTDMQRTFNNERLYQIARISGFKARPRIVNGNKVPVSPQEYLQQFTDDLARRGLDIDAANFANQKIREMLTGQQKTMHPLLQALNSFAYLTTLAGPMSAVLNLADIPLTAAKFGSKEMLDTALTKSNIDLKRMGINQQTYGEFIGKVNESLGRDRGWMSKVANNMRELTDFAMKGSGFAALDAVGKRGVMDAVFENAVGLAKNGGLKEMWGFYFNPQELAAIQRTLLKHGKDWKKYAPKDAELIEELLVAGLGQQQLISAAGRPAGWARNPNARPMWALRGFVIKQQALALREVVDNIKAGNTEKAMGFLGRYAMWGAGGYAVINEGRQFLFGDGNATANGMLRGYGDAWAALLTMNTLGFNDYQWGKLQTEGLATTLAKGTIPIGVSRPLEIGKRIIDAVDGERSPIDPVMNAVPALKQTTRGVRNVTGMLDMPLSNDVNEVTEYLLRSKSQFKKDQEG
jgi:hypothetical protein